MAVKEAAIGRARIESEFLAFVERSRSLMLKGVTS